MSRNWKRYCSLKVAGRSYIADPRNLDDALKVTFQIHHGAIDTPYWVEITLYNLSDGTSQLPKIGDKVEIDAGYIDNFGNIFTGTVTQAARGKENPTDSYLKIMASTGTRAMGFAVVNKTLPKGSTAKDTFDAAVAAMGEFDVSLGFMGPKALQALQAIKYPRGQSLFGMARETIRMLSHTIGAHWWIAEDGVHFVDVNETRGDVTLSSETGLIGIPTETTAGIIVRCLINPTLKVGDSVTIDPKAINEAVINPSIGSEVQQTLLKNNDRLAGTYKIIAIDWSGDTRDNPWYADLTCIGLGGNPMALIDRLGGGPSVTIRNE